jgi:hypothetical protein
VVYEFAATTGQSLNVDLEADFDAVIYVKTSSCGAAGIPLTCSGTKNLVIQALAGGKYWLVIDGTKEKEWGPFKVTVTLQ